jgi:hypothetical protein
MVMIFAVKKVRDFLLENGKVYTVRDHKHKVGRDWITDRRGGRKLRDVDITEVASFDAETDGVGILGKYVQMSGFTSVADWVSCVGLVNHSRLLRRLWVYLVEDIQSKLA